MWPEGDAVDLYWSRQVLQDQCGKVLAKARALIIGGPRLGRQLEPRSSHGVHILEVTAADKHEKGGIAKDDPKFAASLRHCLNAL
jgi:hypothetical protein